MSSPLKARIAFVIAIGLLLACALVIYGTLRSFAFSERLVERSQQIQVLLGETESAIASAARARLTYVFSGQPADLEQYQHDRALVTLKVDELRQSTRDNAIQQQHCDRLEQLVNDRIQLWERSIEIKKNAMPARPGQPDLTRQSVAVGDEIISVMQEMSTEEARVLAARRGAAGTRFLLSTMILATSFAAAVLLLFWHYRLLREELAAREEAEQRASEAARAANEAERKARESEFIAVASNEAARRLTARLLHLQDEERRRLSRELHDSTGQYLAAAKMVFAAIAMGHERDRRYIDCMELIDRSLTDIRTISHLLHPSGLEEAGFSAAARWYAEEFAKRSGVQLKVEISDPPERMPRDIEIALFRVLQEALTNIHRHSKSRSGEIAFRADGHRLSLTIEDHGVGIAKKVLEQFRSSGTAGVGLAGMRERIRELGGTFDVESNNQGTSLRVIIPVRREFALAASE
ncbi:MAG: CHASE3 domain-containing protein [Acidobacteria bacterium]|nr:CHASE3 domain-containing protein [Acidobacteriota bacterium]